MKFLSRTKFLFGFLLYFPCWSLGFESETILKNGPSEQKLDIVFLGEGYTASELDTYRDDVDRFLTHFFFRKPFLRT